MSLWEIITGKKKPLSRIEGTTPNGPTESSTPRPADATPPTPQEWKSTEN